MKKLSPKAQKAYEVIQRCVDAIPIKPVSKSLKDFPGSPPVRDQSRKKHKK